MINQVVLWLCVIVCADNFAGVMMSNLEMDISKKLKENGTALSRKRRYLVFPEGSSFQMVFDLTYPSVGMGNAFVFGNTAAMGFELPSTPIFLDKKKMSKEEEKKPENKTTEKVPEHLEHPVDDDYPDWQPPLILHDVHDDYQDADFTSNFDSSYDSPWSKIDRSPVTFYSNPFDSYVNQNLPQKVTPVNGGYSRYSKGYERFHTNPYNFWNLENKYRNVRRRTPIRLKPAPVLRKSVTHHIHRRSRRELYTKIEKLFKALSRDGKACILKAICQVNKIPKNKGSMWAEIMKAIFKVKPDEFYPDEDHYDTAANSNHDCDKMYPECEGHVLSKMFRKKS